MTNIDSEDYLRGELFAKIGDIVPHAIYCRMDYAPDFLMRFAPTIQRPFVLVTHNSDYSLNEALVSLARRSPNLKKWYGQNVECAPNDLVRSIPIGLENDSVFPHLTKRSKLTDAIKGVGGIEPSKLVYMNYSFYTRRDERVAARQAVIRNCPPSIYTDRCVESIDQTQFGDWLKDVASHHYVLCPRGNGIDTHRMWETLYMGRIPIVKRDSNNRYYEQLPILYVNDWSEINHDMLTQSLPRLRDRSNFNIQMLSFAWWRDQIANPENLK
jgi:hypothetical protein